MSGRLLRIGVLALAALAVAAPDVAADDEPPRPRRRRTPKAEVTDEVAPPPADEIPPPVASPRPSPGDPFQPTAADGQPVLTVHVYEEGAREKELTQVLGGFDAVLSKDERIRYRDLADQLDPPGEAQAGLGDADEKLKDAQAAFEQMDLENARGKAEGAIKLYERYLPQLAAEEDGLTHIRNAWIRLAAVRFFDGNNDGAKDALRHVFALDPLAEFSPKMFPPQMKKVVIESRLLFDALGTGKINVLSDPPRATVFVNGIVKGTAPVVVEEVPAGPSYVSVRRRGFAPQTVVAEVNGGGDEARSEITLTRFDNDPIGPLGQVRTQLGSEEAPPEVVEAARKLRVDLLVAVQIAKDSAGLHVTAFLYDARPKRLLRRVEKVGPVGSAAETAQQAAKELLTDVRLDGVYAQPTPPEKTGFFTMIVEKVGEGWTLWRGWKYFWPSVGALVGVVVVSIVIGVGVGGRASPPPGFTPGEQVILLGGGGQALATPGTWRF
ncbi:MAG: PEGA domain-containing protein [Myxococcales bacterium]|nr:PEGA domain-containing protein [Myxococcales bacterium]